MPNEDAQKNHDEPVVIARAGSLGQADVICAVLRTNDIESFIINENVSQNLPHLGLATQPNGVRIAVRKSDQAEAQMCIDQHGLLEAETEKSVELNDTDRFARRAGVSAIFSILFTPLGFVALWYFYSATLEKHELRPTNSAHFRRNMRLAKFGMIFALIMFVYYIGLFTRD